MALVDIGIPLLPTTPSLTVVHLSVAMPMVATGMTTKVHIDRSTTTKMAPLVHTGRSGVRNLSIGSHRSTNVLFRPSTLTSELLLLVLLLLMMLLLLMVMLLLLLLLFVQKHTFEILSQSDR